MPASSTLPPAAASQTKQRRSIVPSARLLAALALPAGLSMAVVLRPDWLLPVLALDCALVLLALLDLILSRGSRTAVHLDHGEVFSLDHPTPIQVRIQNLTPRPQKLRLRIDLSVGLSLEHPFTGVELLPHQLKSVTLRVRPGTRGAHWVLSAHTRLSSRLGLFELQRAHPHRQAVRVYPDLSPIRSYELLLRQHRQHAMVRASDLRGGETEFARLRDYTTDDDYRFIDWKATARRGKLTSREFQLESDQNIMLLIDSGRLMSAEVGGISYFDQALSSSLLLSHVACRGGDRVGLLCFDEEIRCFLLPAGGPKTTSRLVRTAYDLHPRLTDTTFKTALLTFDGKVKQRCLVVLFTQLIDDRSAEELSVQVRHLSRKHLVLVVIFKDTELLGMALPPTEEREAHPAEVYRRGAAAELINWKGRILSRLKESGAFVLEASAGEVSARLLNRYLELKAHRAI